MDEIKLIMQYFQILCFLELIFYHWAMLYTVLNISLKIGKLLSGCRLTQSVKSTSLGAKLVVEYKLDISYLIKYGNWKDFDKI